MAKRIKRITGFILLVLLGCTIYYAWGVLPGISGFGAKNLCSCMFVLGRDEQSVMKEELSGPFFKWGTYKVNRTDSSVTGEVFGLAKRKAIYRQGLGCTLINDTTEAALRTQYFNMAARPAVNSDTLRWPQGDLLRDSISPGIDLEKLKKAVNNAFAEPNATSKIGTRAVVVLYDGELVMEQYAPGYTMHSKMLGWSIAKSMTAAMTGILVKEGKLKTDSYAPIAQWKDPDHPAHEVTLEHLLRQTSGLNFEENYSMPSEVITMLFSKGNMGGYTAGLPLKNVPGSVFNYSSGNSNILQSLIRQIVGKNEYHQFVYDSFFYKIGMYSALLEPDVSGTFVGSSYIYATARDYARFGLLYYNKGLWNGEQVLPDDWIKNTIIPSAADKRKHYGYQFWLNGLDEQLSKRWYPDAPDDMYFADGYGGQDIYIIPSKKLVVVRLGLHVMNENKFLKEVIGSLQP